MKKEFNITGKCIPNLHYMADVSGKFGEILDMINRGRYFIINRPRQYGKTTALNQLADRLNMSDEYLALRTSFEGVGDSGFQDETSFCNLFLELLKERSLLLKQNKLVTYIGKVQKEVISLKQLSQTITEIVKLLNRKLVILIDEVDKSSNNQLFLHFLGLLRDKYLDRDVIPTFHAVVLAGVHDVKNLKLKLRPGEESKLNSPWNIATEFKVDMNLQPFEIIPMLKEYAADKNVQLDASKMADLLFTSFKI
jgi:hypothetical protein